MSYENKILQMKKMLSKKPAAAPQKVEEPAYQKPTMHELYRAMGRGWAYGCRK
ncbi:hypothetical protein AABM34_08030 [Lysinibacillus fusiformis]